MIQNTLFRITKNKKEFRIKKIERMIKFVATYIWIRYVSTPSSYDTILYTYFKQIYNISWRQCDVLDICICLKWSSKLKVIRGCDSECRDCYKVCFSLLSTQNYIHGINSHPEQSNIVLHVREPKLRVRQCLVYQFHLHGTPAW